MDPIQAPVDYALNLIVRRVDRRTEDWVRKTRRQVSQALLEKQFKLAGAKLKELEAVAGFIPSEAKWVETQRGQIETNARTTHERLGRRVVEIEGQPADLDQLAFTAVREVDDLIRNFKDTEWEAKFKALRDRVAGVLLKAGKKIDDLKAAQVDVLMRRARQHLQIGNNMAAYICYYTVVTRFGAESVAGEARGKIAELEVASRLATPQVETEIKKARDLIFGGGGKTETDAAREKLRGLLRKYPLTPLRSEILHLLESGR